MPINEEWVEKTNKLDEQIDEVFISREVRDLILGAIDRFGSANKESSLHSMSLGVIDAAACFLGAVIDKSGNNDPEIKRELIEGSVKMFEAALRHYVPTDDTSNPEFVNFVKGNVSLCPADYLKAIMRAPADDGTEK